jgi:hypothetical protein
LGVLLVGSIRSALWLFTRNFKAASSVVPRKLVSGIVLELPVRLQSSLVQVPERCHLLATSMMSTMSMVLSRFTSQAGW